MVAVELVGDIVDAERDRVRRAGRTERVRHEELQQVVAVGRLLGAEHAVLLRDDGDFAAHLQRVALVTRGDADAERRNTRKRIVAVLQLTADVVRAELQAEVSDKEVGVRLEPLQQAVGADELDELELFQLFLR